MVWAEGDLDLPRATRVVVDYRKVAGPCLEDSASPRAMMLRKCREQLWLRRPAVIRQPAANHHSH